MPTLRHTAAAVGAIVCVAAAGAIAVITTSTPATAAVATVQPKIPQPNCCARTTLRPGQEIRTSDSVALRTIVAATLPPGAGSSYGQTSTGYSLVLQPDGLLVEHHVFPGGYDQAIWTTGGHRATRLVFQTDHNVVLRDAAGQALWSSGTAGTAATYFEPYGNGQVVTQDATGRILTAAGPPSTSAPGVDLYTATSPGRRFALQVQTDGNVVERDYRDPSHPRVVWSSRTAGAGAVRLVAQQDGNLVVRRLLDDVVAWQSGTHGAVGYYQFDVQDDGNVVLRSTDGVHRLQAIWASSTKV